ncbi:hypothetical protein AAMO2058_000922300 [Amorphochlora amoebiformis]
MMPEIRIFGFDFGSPAKILALLTLWLPFLARVEAAPILRQPRLQIHTPSSPPVFPLASRGKFLGQRLAAYASNHPNLSPNPMQVTSKSSKLGGYSQMARGWEKRRDTSTRVFQDMLAAASVATVAGGALSGGLHAISGPDHLAALLPRCIGQRWWRAGRIALVWGSGHGFSTIVLGMLMWNLKDRLVNGIEHSFLPDLSRWTEGAVGISLMLIGVIGMREVSQWNDAELLAAEESFQNSTASHSNSTGIPSQLKDKFKNGAIFVNGLLHGCSLDGLQTLAPALALSSWRSAVVFVFAHYVGTALSMSACTAVIGEGSLRVGKALKKPQIVRSLSKGSSLIALLVGFIFTLRSVLGM